MNRHANPRSQTVFIVLCIVFVFTVLIAGCGSGGSGGDADGRFFKDPSGEPVKATVRTTVPLAFAASVATEAVKGMPLSNVSVTNTCSAYPCLSVVTIHADSQTMPLTIHADSQMMPFQFTSYGDIIVSGYWATDQTAILTVVFVDMFAGSSLFRIHDVSVFPVIVTPSGLKIVYASIDINIATGPVYPEDLSTAEIDAAFLKLNISGSDDPEVNVSMDAWIVEADHAGTPDDFSDDSYMISGGGQYIDVSSASGSVLQLGMAGTFMEPACSLNPVDGLAVINETEASSSSLPVVATAILSFGPGCDGTAKVILATGNYLLSNGKSIPLNVHVP